MAKEELMTAGGQAVIEGVMMRAKNVIAIAVRKPNNKIIVKKENITPLSDKYRIFGLPFIRGIFNLIEMMVVGIKALNFSANESCEEDEEYEQLSLWYMGLSVIFAIIFAVGLFKFVPLAVAQFTSNNFSIVKENYIIFNLIDGVLKIILFILYALIISLMKDVKRLFQYHGAEHKAVYCYEAKKKLTVSNMKKFSTLHPRCGTSFIIIVLILSILVYTFIPQSFSFWSKLGLRLVLLPVIAGISYELLRLAGKYKNNPVVRILIWPGMMTQKITTKEPDKSQMEVAIKALEAVVGQS